MFFYRTHKCGEVSALNLDEKIKIAGFLHNKRDHGGLLFLDIRDHYGLVQVVISEQTEIERVSKFKLESVLLIEGSVAKRKEGTINSSLKTGEIEIIATSIVLESEAAQVPFAVNTDDECNEEIRLKYRFLDLRRESMHKNIMLRSQVISEVRKQMEMAGFMEFQTPILTASSPEGARDFLVPSRVHAGKFYALPQAPQQFKQLLMVSGFDRYFQIAPCFRDEDARADRSPGEFYQLDIEMAFVTQEEVFATMEPIIYNLFKKFAGERVVDSNFVRIPYDESMLKYGSDKPDLRNPIEIFDASKVFENSEFATFANAVKDGKIVRAIPAPNAGSKPRKFFDDYIAFAKENGASGLAYVKFSDEKTERGPIAKFLSEEQYEMLKTLSVPQKLENSLQNPHPNPLPEVEGARQSLQNGDVVFFTCDATLKASKLAGIVRTKLGKDLDLIDKNLFKFCWITDFPFYELNDEGTIEFSHNPFSMPQGGLDTLLLCDEEFIRKLIHIPRIEENKVFFDIDGDKKLSSKKAEEIITELHNSYKENIDLTLPLKERVAKFAELQFEVVRKKFKVDPLSIKAYQYDIVCNGVELSSGAIRNHKLEAMYKAFEIAGYSKETVNEKFAGMVKAFSYGAPPHGGFAPGIDRIVMLLAGTDSIRDIIAFPMTGKAEDLLMNAPSEVTDKQLDELNIFTPDLLERMGIKVTADMRKNRKKK